MNWTSRKTLTAADELQIKKEKITQGLAKLKERTIKYDTLQQQLNDTTTNKSAPPIPTAAASSL